MTNINRTPPPQQTIAICLNDIRPISNSNTLTPNNMSAVDKFAKAMRINTPQTEPIIGKNDFLTSLISSCLRDNIRARKTINESLAKSEV
ncbi:hypothetical protein D3C86_733560 [compost metagenome]